MFASHPTHVLYALFYFIWLYPYNIFIFIFNVVFTLSEKEIWKTKINDKYGFMFEIVSCDVSCDVM